MRTLDLADNFADKHKVKVFSIELVDSWVKGQIDPMVSQKEIMIGKHLFPITDRFSVNYHDLPSDRYARRLLWPWAVFLLEKLSHLKKCKSIQIALYRIFENKNYLLNKHDESLS